MKKPDSEQTHIINEIDMLSISPYEITGFIPFGPKDDEQLQSYMEMYPFRADCLTESQKKKV